MTDPAKPSGDVWVGRATPRPADPWPPVSAPPTGPIPVPPGYGPPGYGPAGYIATGQLPPGYVHSGYLVVAEPPRRRRRRGLHAFIIVAGIFAACCAGGATLALLSGPLLQGTGTFGSAPPGLNSPVRDGKFEFVVKSVTCGLETVGTLVPKQAQGQYCVVDVSVRNIGTDKQLLLDTAQKAFASDGTEFGADTGAGVVANNGIAVSANLINPGNSVTGKLVYDVPDGVSIARLELHDSYLSNGVTVSL